VASLKGKADFKGHNQRTALPGTDFGEALVGMCAVSCAGHTAAQVQEALLYTCREARQVAIEVHILTRQVLTGDAKGSAASRGSWVVWALSGVCTTMCVCVCVCVSDCSTGGV
jgi:hypothetical protein